MLNDYAFTFAREAALTASGMIGDEVDIQATGYQQDRNIGEGTTSPRIVVTVTEAATAVGSATVVFEFRTSATEAGVASATGDDVAVLSRAYGKAELILGTQLVFLLPPKFIGKKFVGVYGTVATGPLTAGKFTVALQTGATPNYRKYARAVTPI